MEAIEVHNVVKALVEVGSYQTEAQVIEDAISHHPDNSPTKQRILCLGA